MSPLSFTDEEMNSITELASALPPSSRDGFLKLIASNLSGYPAEARGPGLVHRIAAEAQRDFLKGGPIAVGVGGKPKVHGGPPRGYVRLGSNLRHHGEEQEYCEDYQVNDALKHGSSAGAQRDHAGEQRPCQQDLVLRPQPELERLADHD